jgi:hypothetical protein
MRSKDTRSHIAKRSPFISDSGVTDSLNAIRPTDPCLFLVFLFIIQGNLTTRSQLAVMDPGELFDPQEWRPLERLPD